MEFHLKSLKNIFGIAVFCAVIVLSFFIISDIEKTFTLWYSTGVVPVAYDDMTGHTATVQSFPPAPRPPAIIEPLPRIMIHDAEDYFAYKGYPLTAYVEFGNDRLRFHLSRDVDIGYAQLTISHIIEVFDTIHESFTGHFCDFYIVADSSDLPNRRVNYKLATAFVSGGITYLFFVGQYPIPVWLSVGLENYLMGGDVPPLSNECLAIWLQQGTGGPPHGDAWFMSSLRQSDITHDEILAAAYTIVRRWSQAGELYDFVRLAQTDTRAFGVAFSEYISQLTGQDAAMGMHVLYKFGNFAVVTPYGSYTFIGDGYVWTWARVLSFTAYMDAAIDYVSYRFFVNNSDGISVTLYPFGASTIPYAIAEMAYTFGWDIADINFVADDKITLAGTARFGTWAMSHEVAHILLFREFIGYHPASWMVEGMAVLGELLFRDSFEGVKPYRFNAPLLSNIDAKARHGNGHVLPFFCDEETFGRASWTYDDAGSFVLYLYNNYGIEALLEMYRSDNYSQFDMAIEIFGKELSDLIYNWRMFLWPNGEPTGWWSR
ncbi:MAG: hypothetical protein FWC92_01670 [Defluviitaleaceae bacterium]|nr:hypothetical protein [Defluviitaleaceae bacterium]